MKLFFREHAGLIVLELLQFGVIFAVLALGGFQDLRLLFYAFGLGLFFFTAYLVYQWMSRRLFYERLSGGLEKMDDALEKLGSTPVEEALGNLLKAQYKHYMEGMLSAQDRQEEHMIFMDRWVHQMKTPLSVIELTAQSLDEPDSSNIREETERMRTGLNTVLYMARFRTIEQDFHFRPVRLSKLVQDVNLENRRYYIRNEVYPKLEEEKSGITVQTDEKWLFFILSQLIHNAVKYSAGKSSKINLAIYERNGEAVIEVTDKGIGIPEPDRKRVFDKFFTGENGRKHRESTGMGLYLVREVSRRLGHGLEMESVTGEGTSFRIIFTPTQNLTSM